MSRPSQSEAFAEDSCNSGRIEPWLLGQVNRRLSLHSDILVQGAQEGGAVGAEHAAHLAMQAAGHLPPGAQVSHVAVC